MYVIDNEPIFDTDNYLNRRISIQDQDRQSKTIYLTDDEFENFKKVSGEYKKGKFVEGELTPDRYDFYAQNCAKGVCQALNVGPRKGTSFLHDATLSFQNAAYEIGASDILSGPNSSKSPKYWPNTPPRPRSSPIAHTSGSLLISSASASFAASA